MGQDAVEAVLEDGVRLEVALGPGALLVWNNDQKRDGIYLYDEEGMRVGIMLFSEVDPQWFPAVRTFIRSVAKASRRAARGSDVKTKR